MTKIHPTIFLGYKNNSSSFSEDRLRIGALKSTGTEHIQTVDSFLWQSVRYIPVGSNK